MARCKNVKQNQVIDFDAFMLRRQNGQTSGNVTENPSNENIVSRNQERLSQSLNSSDEVDLDLSGDNMSQNQNVTQNQSNMAQNEDNLTQNQNDMSQSHNVTQNSISEIQGGNETLSQNLPTTQNDSMVVNYNWFLNETINNFENELNDEICHSQHPGPVSLYTQEITAAPEFIDDEEDSENTNWRQISIPVAPPAPPCSQETEQQYIPITINVIQKNVPTITESRSIFKIPYISIQQNIKKTQRIKTNHIDNNMHPITTSSSITINNEHLLTTPTPNNIINNVDLTTEIISSSAVDFRENEIENIPPLDLNNYILPPPPPSTPPTTEIPPPPPSPPLRLSQIPLPPNPAPVVNIHNIPLDKSINHGDDTFDDDFISVSSEEPLELQPSTISHVPNSISNKEHSKKQQIPRKAIKITGKKLPSKYNNVIRQDIIIAISDEDSDDSDFLPVSQIKKTEPVLNNNSIVDQERAKKDKINARRFLRQWHKQNPGQKFPRQKQLVQQKKTSKKNMDKKEINRKRKRNNSDEDDEDIIKTALRRVAVAAQHGHPDAARLFGNRTPYYPA